MFNGYYSGKTVLVTGDTGFKGSWLTTWLLMLGARVIGVAKDIPTNPSMFETLELGGRIAHNEFDIRDLDRLCDLVVREKPDVVFHLAAQPIVSLSYVNPIETLSTNIMGTAHMLEALRRSSHPCCAVIITSDKCYDNVEWLWGYRENDSLGGKDIYSGSKGAAELVFKSYFHSFLKDTPVRIASARAGNVIGGGDWACDRIVPDCMRAWSSGKAVEIRSPRATRPWQHVLEPLSGYLELARTLADQPQAAHGESFNFGPRSDYNYTVEQIIHDLSRSWNFANSSEAYFVGPGASFAESGLLKLNCDKALHQLSWVPTMEYRQMIDAVGTWYYRYYCQSAAMFEVTVGQIDDYVRMAAEKGIAWAVGGK